MPWLELSVYCGMYIPLSDDKHQMVRDSSKKRTGQRGRNSNPVAMLPHAAVVFRVQLFNNAVDVFRYNSAMVNTEFTLANLYF